MPRRPVTRKIHATRSDALVQCLNCELLLHRTCLSWVHHVYWRQRTMRGLWWHQELVDGTQDPEVVVEEEEEEEATGCCHIQKCSRKLHLSPSANGTSTASSSATASEQSQMLMEDTSLSKLMEDLALATTPVASQWPSAPCETMSSVTPNSRLVPLMATGGVLGLSALALGPIGGLVASYVSASIGLEAVVAGLGLTAAAATASTLNKRTACCRRSPRVTTLQTSLMDMASCSEWAESCYNGSVLVENWVVDVLQRVKQEFAQKPLASDAHFRQDAALLKEFNGLTAFNGTAAPVATAEAEQCTNKSVKRHVHRFLLQILATRSEFLSQLNAQLAAEFRRRLDTSCAALSSTSPQAISSSGHEVTRVKQLLLDLRSYLQVMVLSTLQLFPSFQCNDQSVVLCVQVLEQLVFEEFASSLLLSMAQCFDPVNDQFRAKVGQLREQFDPHTTFNCSTATTTPPLVKLMLEDPNIEQAQKHMREAFDLRVLSPLEKLQLLCQSFRLLCEFAKTKAQEFFNADLLIPLVCWMMICSEELETRQVASQFALISFFTQGGGKGVEGYALTTFEAAFQVIVSIDQTLALELSMANDSNPARDTQSVDHDEDDDDDYAEFYDAQCE